MIDATLISLVKIYSIGVREDVIVMIKDCPMPVDFYVIDMYEDASVPIILDRPFFRTSGAMINMQEGNIKFTLLSISFVLRFPKKKKKGPEAIEFKMRYFRGCGFAPLEPPNTD